MKLKLAIFLFGVLSCNWVHAQVRGCVAFFEKGKPTLREVNLVPFDENHLIDIKGLSKELVPDKSGRYCYSLDDDRLAFVSMYYFATKMIHEYNVILAELGLKTIQSLPISLHKETHPKKCLGRAQASPDGIQMTFQHPAVDYTTIDHEIGHMIHFHLATEEEDEDEPEKDGIYEGTGNLLAALHLEQTRISGIDLSEDLAPDINQFVRYPFSSQLNAKVHKKSTLEFLKKNPACEMDVKVLTQLLGMPEMQELLNAPDPYVASAVINQPLWQASLIFGKAEIQRLYLKTLSQLKHNTFQTLARELVQNAKAQGPALSEFLQKAYSERGLI